MFYIGNHVSAANGFEAMGRKATELGGNTLQIADALNEVLWKDCKTTILLETMAGKGSEIGGSFEELQAIIERIEYKEKIGVCLDTCHIWDGGYDIVNHLDDVLKEFDRIIGLDVLFI